MTKKIICIIAILFAGLAVPAQSNARDVVYLKNGSVVKGVIIEQIPGVSIKIETADGSIFVYKVEELEKITKEQTATPQQNQNVPQIQIYQQNYAQNPPPVAYRGAEKSPFLAGFLSFLFPGAGQLYATNWKSGWGFVAWSLLGYPALVGLSAALFDVDVASYVLLGASLAHLGIWIYSIVNASSTAKKVNIQNGYLSFKLGEKTSLGVRPELGYNNFTNPNGGMTGAFTTGIGISLNL